jgi:hypothetical protein
MTKLSDVDDFDRWHQAYWKFDDQMKKAIDGSRTQRAAYLARDLAETKRDEAARRIKLGSFPYRRPRPELSASAASSRPGRDCSTH